MYSKQEALKYLEYAHIHATKHSGCTKVEVGSVIVTSTGETVFGANVTVPNWCRTNGCLRVELFGENSKEHRGVAECRAVHSEVDAIATAARNGIAVDGATIFVTRYPCEGCARAIVRAGIARVVFGRKQDITEQTRTIFEWGGVEITWVDDFEAEDVFT